MKEKNHILDIYIEIKAFEINAYIFLEIEFEILFGKFNIRIELAAEVAKGVSSVSRYKKKIPVKGTIENFLFSLIDI